MAKLAIIGGTGLTQLDGLKILRRETVSTRWGEPSAPLLVGELGDCEVVFLARHGERHEVPPHRVNYRANLQALHDLGVEQVIAVAAVGGIDAELAPGAIVIPDQLIDYTWGREHTFFDGAPEPVEHIDFTDPYCEALRLELLGVAERCGIGVVDGGVYGATQGPRLETAAEIDRMRRDGCSLVGMTGMPETALARELGLCYACCAVVANRAAGCGDAVISMDEIRRTLDSAMAVVRRLLTEFVKSNIE